MATLKKHIDVLIIPTAIFIEDVANPGNDVCVNVRQIDFLEVFGFDCGRVLKVCLNILKVFYELDNE
ncbi:MAG: hypothetical protein LBB74_09810 [Chitinispirillales bacterium]|jgi:hypothetical protein|nr:hypothetical protein [Chitinispirillales bacterium]